MRVDDQTNRVLGAARQALGTLRGAPARVGEVGPREFPQLLAATFDALQAQGHDLPLAEVRQLLATSVAELSASRGITAQVLLATTTPPPPSAPPKMPGHALLQFQLGRHDDELHRSTVSLLGRTLTEAPRPVGAVVRGWLKALDHRPEPRTRALLELADRAGITISQASLASGLAHFDPASGSVKLDLAKIERHLAEQGKPLTAERLVDRIVAHELIHGLIHARAPNYDYQAKKVLPRPDFDSGLTDILARLDATKASPEVQKILAVIRASAPQNLPEEVVTYTLTVPDLERFVRSQGQLAPLQAHLRRHGLGDLV